MNASARCVGAAAILAAGAAVALELTFVDAKGVRHVASPAAVIRGIAARCPDGSDPDAAKP